jgi:ubiquinone/menaquinone biosynthesis C-methylase UbiE
MDKKLIDSITKIIEYSGLDERMLQNYIRLNLLNQKLGNDRGKNGVDIFRNLEYTIVINMMNIQEGNMILDAGCGDSLFPLFMLDEYQIKLFVLDINMHVLHLQKGFLNSCIFSNRKVEFCRSNMSYLPFTSSCFDRISAISSVEHIRGDGDIIAFTEFKKLLSPGGILVMTLPFAQNFLETSDSSAGYEKRYDQSSLDKRFPDSTDFNLVERKYFGHEKIGPFADLWYKINLYEELGVLSPFITSRILKLEDEPKGHTAGVILAYKKYSST